MHPPDLHQQPKLLFLCAFVEKNRYSSHRYKEGGPAKPIPKDIGSEIDVILSERLGTEGFHEQD